MHCARVSQSTCISRAFAEIFNSKGKRTIWYLMQNIICNKTCTKKLQRIRLTTGVIWILFLFCVGYFFWSFVFFLKKVEHRGQSIRVVPVFTHKSETLKFPFSVRNCVSNNLLSTFCKYIGCMNQKGNCFWDLENLNFIANSLSVTNNCPLEKVTFQSPSI